MESTEPGPRVKTYGEFPLSIRIAQRSIVIAVMAPIFILIFVVKGKIQLWKAWPKWLSIAIGAFSGPCALVGLIATYYAVIRYPYIGLVDATDGDLYHKYIESRSNWIQVAVKLLCLVVAGIGIVAPVSDGVVTAIDWLIVLYSIAIFLFVLFLLLYYDRIDHPAITTFLRCSMGLGLFFYPFFIPALVIGSFRAEALLGDAMVQLESKKKRPGPR